MGGRLRVRSQLGSGATFEFAIPITAEQLSKSLEMQAKDAEDGKDDDPEFDDHHPAVPTDGTPKPEGGGQGRAPPFSSVNERMVGSNELHPMLGRSVRTGLEMGTIEEGDREPRRSHHHPYQHDAHSRSVSSTGRSTSASQSVMSLSQPIKWHIDWFPDEYYETNDRLEQKQMMEQVGVLPEHFNTTPPDLSRTVQSAPPDVTEIAVSTPPAPFPRVLEQSSSTSQLLGSPVHTASATRAFTNSNSDSQDSQREARTGSAESSSSESPEPPPPVKGSAPESDSHPTPLPPVRPLLGASTTRVIDTLSPSVEPSPILASATRSLSESITSTPLTGTSTMSSASSTSSTSSSGNRRRISKAAVITPQGPRLRILVVEDNPVNQKVAKRLLEKDGHTIVLANNGQEALDLWGAEKSSFDCVLMDLHMPIMDGLTATRSIRQAEAVAAYQAQRQQPSTSLSAAVSPGRPAHNASMSLSARQDSPTTPPLPSHPHHIPIIAVTASALEEDANRCMESGFDDMSALSASLTSLHPLTYTAAHLLLLSLPLCVSVSTSRSTFIC